MEAQTLRMFILFALLFLCLRFFIDLLMILRWIRYRDAPYSPPEELKCI